MNKVLNKKCQKCLSGGLQMPYLCIIALLHHSASLFRLLVAFREIIVKCCRQVIPWQNTLRWPVSSFAISHLLQTIPYMDCIPASCIISIETLSLAIFFLGRLLFYFYSRKRIKTAHVVCNKDKLAFWETLPNLLSIVTFIWLCHVDSSSSFHWKFCHLLYSSFFYDEFHPNSWPRLFGKAWSM